MTTDIHSCSYYCERPECVRAQRDELVKRFVETSNSEVVQALVREKYDELLLAVERKYPNESKHKTVLRYIREAESDRINCGAEKQETCISDSSDVRTGLPDWAIARSFRELDESTNGFSPESRVLDSIEDRARELVAATILASRRKAP